ncbi:MAG: NADH-quinone oxidoreductase subunit NuoH [Armatimonadetes bacterium]|nr:NADH-quinone oxidoreductase subunit NuoH [Armatimonadota bacterium]
MDFGWYVFFRAVVLPILAMVGIMSAVPVWIWLERKFSALMQQRLGPNRVGPFGLLQPLADAAKLLFKEDITPAHVDRLVYLMAPVIALIPALASFAVVPFGHDLGVRQYLLWGPVVGTLPAQVADVNVGVLVVLALSSLAVYGVVLAGWSSNNKWSLLGGIRSAAQMVSYELGLGLSIVAIVITNSAYGTGQGLASLSLNTAVMSQQGISILGWNFIWHFPAFVLFCICALAETNRAPFDLPEAEQELTGGFHTEYSAFRFAMFFMGEYAAMTTLSAVGISLFLGGWLSPFANVPVIGWLTVDNIPVLGALAPIFWFSLKVFLVVCVFIWVRFTLPRLRWDQLMKLGWMVLLPLGLLWVTVVGVLQGIALAVAGPQGASGFGASDAYKALVLLAYLVLAVIMFLRKPGRRAAAS